MQKKNLSHQEYKKIKEQNIFFNNKLRNRFSKENFFGEVRELEYVEKIIEQTKSMEIYRNGGFEIDDDVAMMLNSLREKCIYKLKQEADSNLEWYERRIDKGESPERVHSIYAQAMRNLEKIDKIQNDIEKQKLKEEKTATNQFNWHIIIVAIILVLIVSGIFLIWI